MIFRSFSKNLLTASLALGLFSTSAMAVDLAAIHDIAVKQDPQLRSAALRMQAIDYNKDIAWANFYPQISGSVSRAFGGNDTLITGGGDLGLQDIATVSTIDTESYQIQLTQSVFNWRNYAELDRARAQVSQAEYDYEQAYQSFLIRVSEAYFNVLTARDSLTFAQAEAKALNRQFDQAEQRFEVGLTAVTDVLDARASYDQARARVIAAENALEDANEGIRELTKTYFESLEILAYELPLVKPDPLSPDQWVNIAMRNNPELLSSRQVAEISESDVRLQRSGHFPTIDLVASFGQSEDNKRPLRNDAFDIIAERLLTSNTAQVQLQLNVPIFTGFRTSSLTKQAKFNMNAAYEDVEQAERSTFREVENAYRAILADIEEVQAREQAVISARGALDSTQAGFEVGTRTIVDVLLSEQRFFQAQRDYSTARHNYILDHLRLKRAAGILESEDLVRVNALLEKPENVDPLEAIQSPILDSSNN